MLKNSGKSRAKAAEASQMKSEAFRKIISLPQKLGAKVVIPRMAAGARNSPKFCRKP